MPRALRHDDQENLPATGTHLARLEDLDDFKVADGFSDPRGWDAMTRDGRHVGTVRGLLVDPRALRVRYLALELDDDVRARSGGRRVDVPVAAARLDDEQDHVLLDLDVDEVIALGTVDLTHVPHEDAHRFDDRR